MPHRSERIQHVFRVLHVIKRTVDETHALALRAIGMAAANDRALADELRDGASRAITANAKAKSVGTDRRGLAELESDLADLQALMKRAITDDPARFHALCLRVIDEREKLAAEIEGIRTILAGVEPEARKGNLGEEARGTGQAKEGKPS
jgi:hypothetical protein